MFSRGLASGIVGITVVPLGALFWVGWRFLEQERMAATREAQQGVERAADLVSAAFQRVIGVSEQQLAGDNTVWVEGAVAVTFRGGRIEANPRDRLAFVPVVEPLREAPDAIFVEGQRAEFQQHDRPAAIAAYRELRKSSDRAVQAGAILRLARNLRAAEANEAVAEYAKLSSFDDVNAGGVPASLAGAYARCEVLEEAGRGKELLQAAGKLRADLRRSQWKLTESVYEVYASDAARWTVSPPDGPAQSELFAQAAKALWEQKDSLAAFGRQLRPVGTQAFVVLWRKSDDEFRALIASEKFAEAQWIAAASTVAQDHGAELILGLPPASGRLRAVRTAKETDLPWDLTVVSIGPPVALNSFETRRKLLVAGFILLALVVSGANCLVLRAVKRETALAQAQSNFVAAVSHEFRTPLTTLAQFTERLRERPGLSEDSRRVCYEAQYRATARLTRLVESLLDFGLMKSGARHYNLEPGELGGLVERVVDDFRSEAAVAAHHIAIHRNGPIWALTDSEALSLAVWNLLENAVKYSPERPEVEVGLEADEISARISVRDHGIGIPDSEQKVVFKRFQRGEEARRRGIPGTGIGLALVAEIVKAHEGRIELESQLGEGSTFTIVLPVREARGADSDRRG